MADDSEVLAEGESLSSTPHATEAGKTSLFSRDFILIALINLTTFVGFNMTTTGMPVYVATLGAPDVVVGLVTTFATAAALLVRPFAGLMLDRFGRKGILSASVALMALIIVAYAVFPLVGLILALRAVHGVGWGLSSTATSTIAADVIPHKRFAEGMGYFALTSAVAVAVAPALSIGLLQSVGVVPMIVVAAGSTALSFCLTLFQRADKAAFVAAPEVEATPQPTARPPFKLSDLFDKRALLPAGIMLLINVAFSAITTFIALHGQAEGVDNIFLYFTVYALVTIMTRPVIGKIIDRTGFFMPGVLSCVGVAVTLVLIAFSDNIGMFCFAGVFGGLGIGAGMGTLQAMAVAAVSPARRGVATATFLFGMDAGIAVGSAVAGVLAGLVGYSTMYLIMIVFPLAACVVFLVVGRKRIALYSAR